MSISVSQLVIHPVKSMATVPLNEVEISALGLAGDRRFMVVQPDGEFVTARKSPELVRITAQLRDNQLILSHEKFGSYSVSLTDSMNKKQETKQVSIWRDNVIADQLGEGVNDWISKVLGTAVELVHMGAAFDRPVDPDYAKEGDKVSFADGFPVLIISDASIDDLSSRVGEPVSMSRFRPNITVSGTKPFAEDGWKAIRIGGIQFDLVKPCERCVLTTVDPVTGIKHPNGQPLRTLAKYRRSNEGKVNFGMNAIPRGQGVIRVGDTVEIIS